MAEVSISVGPAHATRARKRDRGNFIDYAAECTCGWRGPSYPVLAEAIDAAGLHIDHLSERDSLAHRYLIEVGSGR